MPNKKQTGDEIPNVTEYQEITLEKIDDPVRPMRQDIDRESLDELVRSIKQVGLIEPVIVKPVGDRYEVIAGHRRILACEFAGLPSVPCHIKQPTDDEAEMMKIHENLYRRDISPIEEAQHFDYLIQNKKLTPSKVAQLIGRNVQYVTDRLAILSYDEELAEALRQELISFTVAKEFSRIDEKSKLKQYLTYAIRGGITAGLAKKWVDDLMKPVVMQGENEMPAPEPIQPFSQTEQVESCFFCMNGVKLLEAQVVYVHDECVKARQEMEQGEETGPPAQ